MINLETAVLITDMQTGFLSKAPPIKKEELISKIISLTYFCKEKDIPIFVLEYKMNLYDFGETDPILKKAIKKVPRYFYIIKSREDGFHNTSLKKDLDDWNIKRIILTGISTSNCVMFTGMGAKKAGFKILTSYDLTADVSSIGREMGDRWLKENGLFLPSYKDLIQKVEVS